MRRLRLTVAATLAASLMLAGCGDDDGDSNDNGEGAKQVGDGAELSSTWPLTGLPVESDGSSELKRPVLVVKMDNTYSSAPQIGLSKADMVVEELVEGGLTRLAAFYYSQIPSNAGPVRSMRASDIGIVKPVDARMVTSGAAGVTIARLQKAGVKFYGEGTKGSYRDSGRAAPYNLFVRLDELAKSLEKGDAKRPQRLPALGRGGRLPRGRRHAPSPRRSPVVTPPTGRSRPGSTATTTPTPPTATSSWPTPCWCSGSGSATPATATPPATRSRRRSSRAPAPRWSSTRAASCGAPGPRTGRQRADAEDQGGRS